MAAASKERTEEEQAAEAAQKRKEADAILSWLGPLCFAVVTGGQLLNQSRPQLVRRICNGDQVSAAAMLANFAGLGGAAEFLLNPVIGRVSDRVGRRPMLLMSPLTCAFLRGLVFAFPTSARIIMLERMLSSAVVTGFFSTMWAMLNDKLSGKDLVIGFGKLSTYAGSGVILGPYIEVLVMRFFGGRANFGVVAMLNVLVTATMWRVAKESLPESERKPITLKDCSPLTFLGMAKAGWVNIRLMMILLLQSFGEIRILQDINMLNFRENLTWAPTEVSYFMSIVGMSVVAGGKTVKQSIETFGMKGHTTLSNLAMALSFVSQGAGSSTSFLRKFGTQYLALFLWFIGGRKRDAVETLCTDITLANTDMGKGQVASALSNFKSLAAIFGPPISGQAYNIGMSKGNPGLPYQLIAVCYLMAELIHFPMYSERTAPLELEQNARGAGLDSPVNSVSFFRGATAAEAAAEAEDSPGNAQNAMLSSQSAPRKREEEEEEEEKAAAEAEAEAEAAAEADEAAVRRAGLDAGPHEDASGVQIFTASRPDLQFRPLQYVKVSDAFKEKHLDSNGYLKGQNMSPSDQCKLRNRMLQRYPPAPLGGQGRRSNPLQRLPEARVNNNPGQGGTQKNSMCRGNVNFQVVSSKDGKKVTEAAMPATWAHMRRDDGGLEIERSRMKGALNEDNELNHYGGKVDDDDTQLPRGGRELAKQMALFGIGAGVGMALHVAEHHVHKNDTVKGKSAALAEACAGEAGGSNADARVFHAQAVAGAGDLGAQAAASACGARARAQACGGIPGCGGLAAPVAEAATLAAEGAAEAGILGARAAARAGVARASAGLDGTPVTAAVEFLGAGAAGGVHAGHIGGYVDAHVAEAQAGPFGVRVGLKFGGGLENGIPVVHAGPVSTPCSVM